MADKGSYIDSSSSASKTFHGPCKKQLFKDCTQEVTVDEELNSFNVFLRMKPFSNQNESNDAFQIIDDKTLLTKVDEKPSKLRNRIEFYTYSFSKIFNADSNQNEIFHVTAHESVSKLFDGHNTLLFTYGTTSAGKTYTVLGTKSHPGLIPRVLGLVFKTIKEDKLVGPIFMPERADSIKILSNHSIDSQMILKDKVLNCELYLGTEPTIPGEERYSVELSEAAQVFKCMEKVLNQEVLPLSLSTENQNSYYSVWISFIEIYNELIYDLLVPINTFLASERKCLKLGMDDKKPFVKDINYINVTTAEEAYKIFLSGRKNLQVASTKLNKHSSRSHCIFTIILVKTPEKENPDYCQISRYTICDLAGAERQKKTLNCGDRLKESKNINTSLHKLSRCFGILRDNQKNSTKLMVPFRESKLTNLFQQALLGKESINMIVNISPDLKLFDETQQVLRSSAVARDIVLHEKPKQNIKKIRRSQMFQNVITQYSTMNPMVNASTVTTGVTTLDCIREETNFDSISSPPENYKEMYMDVLKTNDKLKRSYERKLKEVESKLMKSEEANLRVESTIRQEVVSKFEKIYESTMARHKARITEMRERLKECHDKEMDLTFKLQEAKAAIEELKRKSALNWSVSIIEEEPGGVDEKIKELENAHQAELEKLKDDYKQIIEEKKKLFDDLEKMKSECNLVTLEKNQLAVELENVRVELKESSNKEIKLKENEESYLKKIQELESCVKEKDAVLEEAISELATHEENAKALAEAICNNEKLIRFNEELKGDLDDAVSQIAQLNEQINLKDIEIDSLKLELNNKSKQIEEFKTPGVVTRRKKKLLEDPNKLNPHTSTCKSDSEVDEPNAILSQTEIQKSSELEVPNRRRLITLTYDPSTSVETTEDSNSPAGIYLSPVSQFNLIAPIKGSSTKKKSKKK